MDVLRDGADQVLPIVAALPMGVLCHAAAQLRRQGIGGGRLRDGAAVVRVDVLGDCTGQNRVAHRLPIAAFRMDVLLRLAEEIPLCIVAVVIVRVLLQGAHQRGRADLLGVAFLGMGMGLQAAFRLVRQGNGRAHEHPTGPQGHEGAQDAYNISAAKSRFSFLRIGSEVPQSRRTSFPKAKLKEWFIRSGQSPTAARYKRRCAPRSVPPPHSQPPYSGSPRKFSGCHPPGTIARRPPDRAG